jgi:hypothetical protein
MKKGLDVADASAFPAVLQDDLVRFDVEELTIGRKPPRFHEGAPGKANAHPAREPA